ncbi:MAG: putative toxin-antitoxin system toxin component, PIN family [Thermodesulfobacteriota bacterium]|nr:putative toxin-antitoxin system toxin component, PIN family [Thermodesulfobacteriota bacterium]
MAVRAVIDTNIWVSALLNPSGYPARLRKSFEEGVFKVVVSEPILEELADVLQRPRIRKKYDITTEGIEEIITLIEERSEHVLLSGNIEICRDKDDNFVIETAIKGKAEYIVTRDDDIKFDKEVLEFLSEYDISATSVAKFLKIIERS